MKLTSVNERMGGRPAEWVGGWEGWGVGVGGASVNERMGGETWGRQRQRGGVGRGCCGWDLRRQWQRPEAW